MAPDRLDQPELADARDFLPTGDDIRLRRGSVLQRLDRMEVCDLHAGGGLHLLHIAVAGCQSGPGSDLLVFCDVHGSVVPRCPPSRLLQSAGGGLAVDPDPDQLPQRPLYLADRSGRGLLVQRPRGLSVRLYRPGAVCRLASDHAPAQAVDGGDLQHSALAGPLWLGQSVRPARILDGRLSRGRRRLDGLSPLSGHCRQSGPGVGSPRW